MQRLFSTFPDGRPGVGLLILRASIAAALIVQGGSATALFVAVPLAAGFVTPAAAVVAAVTLGFSGAPWLAAIAVALALIGPGGYSVDARLFGRREIVIES